MIVKEMKSPWAPLPTQGQESAEFHKAVLKAYGCVSDVCANALSHAVAFLGGVCRKNNRVGGELSAKKEFQARKQKKREARRAKKAEDHKDKSSAQSASVMRKQKGKRQSKTVY